MIQSTARMIGVVVFGAALLLPLAGIAQAPPKDLATAEAQRANDPPPPVTAPTGAVPVNPERGKKPGVSTATGSTAIPGWNHPPASWEAPSETPQYASLPGRETNVLIQVTGREWREFHNGPQTFYGGIILLLPFAALLVFFLWKGPLKVQDPLTGRTIERFSGIQRATHWTMAISFVLLALSGIVLLFGKHIVLPWLGHEGFSWLAIVAKSLHNFVGPLFMFALVIFITLFAKDNLPKAYDWQWIPKFGGMLSGEHVPSGKFNAGEKALFWSLVAFFCVILSITGLILDFPNWNQGREAMQIANVIHGVCAICAMAMACFHIYLGTIGMQGAFKAMRTGQVDETWAREHHEIWYREMKR